LSGVEREWIDSGVFPAHLKMQLYIMDVRHDGNHG